MFVTFISTNACYSISICSYLTQINISIKMMLVFAPRSSQYVGRIMIELKNIRTEDNIKYMNRFDDEYFHLIVTSPPYNIGKEYEKKVKLNDYLQWQENIIEVAVKKLNAHGSLCWQVGNYIQNGEIMPLDILLYPIFQKFGLKLRNRIIWHFEHGFHCKKRLSGRYETILWFTKTDNYTFNLDPIRVPSKYPNKKYFKGDKKGQLSCNPLGKNPGDIWIFPNVKHNHVEKTEHPCQFPVELVERLVLSLTNPQDYVLDPFLGSGTSAIAALKNNRNAFGCDINKKYIQISKRRIKLLENGQLKTRPMNKPVYDPTIKR